MVTILGLSIVMRSLVVSVPAASPLHPVKTSCLSLPVATLLLIKETVVVVPALYHPAPVVEPTVELTAR